MASSPPRLAPSVSIDEIGERDTATEPNRQQDIGVDAGGKPSAPSTFFSKLNDTHYPGRSPAVASSANIRPAPPRRGWSLTSRSRCDGVADRIRSHLLGAARPSLQPPISGSPPGFTNNTREGRNLSCDPWCCGCSGKPGRQPPFSRRAIGATACRRRHVG